MRSMFTCGSKAFAAMVADRGTVMYFSAVPVNAEGPMLLSMLPMANVTDSRLKLFWNAPCLMFCTDAGMITLFTLDFPNASAPIVSSPSFRRIVVSCVHSWKAAWPISRSDGGATNIRRHVRENAFASIFCRTPFFAN